jgi:hypothetical protein
MVMRKTTNNLSHNSRGPGRYSNRAPSEYNRETLLFEPVDRGWSLSSGYQRIRWTHLHCWVRLIYERLPGPSTMLLVLYIGILIKYCDLRIFKIWLCGVRRLVLSQPWNLKLLCFEWFSWKQPTEVCESSECRPVVVVSRYSCLWM